MFVDRVIIFVKGGDGGKGCCSFRRERKVPRGGPDGGDGGNGGNVIFRAVAGTDSLAQIVNRKFWKAENGKPGTGANKSGKQADDLIIAVPPGTIIVDRDRGHTLRDLSQPGEEVVVCRGGRGGRGNTWFATATNRTPREFQPGETGEEHWVILELKVIADAGVIGLPNAGKSTLLSRLSQAHPEIADYPFTTKHPNLGMVYTDEDRGFVLADLPGLIEGAHSGVGLGHEFLRHVDRTRLLVHLVEPFPSDGSDPVQNYRTVRHEVEMHSQSLRDKLEIVAMSKCEIPGSDEVHRHMQQELGKDVLAVSAITGQGLATLVETVAMALKGALATVNK
jgi:GTP-binding protein